MTKKQAVTLANKINHQITKRGDVYDIYSFRIYDSAFPILIDKEYQIIMRRSDTMIGDYRLVPLSWLRFKLGEEIDLAME